MSIRKLAFSHIVGHQASVLARPWQCWWSNLFSFPYYNTSSTVHKACSPVNCLLPKLAKFAIQSLLCDVGMIAGIFSLLLKIIKNIQSSMEFISCHKSALNRASHPRQMWHIWYCTVQCFFFLWVSCKPFFETWLRLYYTIKNIFHFSMVPKPWTWRFVIWCEFVQSHWAQIRYSKVTTQIKSLLTSFGLIITTNITVLLYSIDNKKAAVIVLNFKTAHIFGVHIASPFSHNPQSIYHSFCPSKSIHFSILHYIPYCIIFHIDSHTLPQLPTNCIIHSSFATVGYKNFLSS